MEVNDDEECGLLFGLCSLVIEFDQFCSNHREVPGPIFSFGVNVPTFNLFFSACLTHCKENLNFVRQGSGWT